MTDSRRLSFQGSDAHPGGQRQSFLGFLRITEIADTKDKHTYDAYEYIVDSGEIFKAGSTDVVAEVLQFGLECQDPAWKEALQVVLKSRT